MRERSDRRRIINIVKNESHKSDKVAEVIQFVRQSGGIEYAREAMYRFREEAFALLDEELRQVALSLPRWR